MRVILDQENPLLNATWEDISSISISLWIRSQTQPDLSAVAVQRFQNNLAHVQERLQQNPLIHRIQPAMFCVTSFQFIYLVLKTQLDEYFLDQPEDLEIRDKWKDFCMNLALMRYRKDPALLDQVSVFLNEIQDKFKLQATDSLQQSYVQNLMDLFTEVKRDPELLDVSLGTLFGMGQKTNKGRNIPVSVVHLQSVFYLIAREMRMNYVWLLNYTQSKVDEHFDQLDKQYYGDKSWGQIYREGMKIFKAIGPIIDRLQCESIEKILKKIPEVKKLATILTNLANESIANLTPILANMKALSTFMPESAKQSIPRLEELNQCHMLIDAYLFNFVVTLSQIEGSTLLKWFASIENKPLFSRNRRKFFQSIPKVIDTAWFLSQEMSLSSPSSSSVGTPFDLNSALAFIEGRKEGRRPQRGKNSSSSSRRRMKAVISPKPPSSVTKVSLPIVPEPQLSSEPIQQVAESSQPSLPDSLEIQILKTVLQKIPEQPSDKTPYLRSSLRQVELALSSLINEHEKVHRMAPEDFEGYDYHAMISKMYYLIEQVLRYKNIERDPSSGDFSHHVLERLQKLGDYNNPIAAIVKKLFSANLWGSYTENQITSRQRINLMNDCRRVLTIPPILSNLYQIFYAPTPELCVRLKNEIESLYRETLAFVAFYIPLEIQEGPSIKLSTKSCKVTLEKTFDLAMMGLFQQKLHGVIDGEFGSDMKDKLSQGKRNLSFLTRTLKNLTSPELTLEEFSPLLRSTIHLTHQVCESVFQLFFIKKHGIETHEHQLDTLIKACLEGSSEEMSDFFRLHFQGINTDYRYPFDLGSIRSLLHQLILEAEFLRERTELEEGFAFVSETASTSLNFIKLPEVAFTTQKIWDRASQILSQALNLVFEDALPRFNGRFSGASSSQSR